MSILPSNIKINRLALEFVEVEQNESYQNYVQIKGTIYSYTLSIYSLFWQIATAFKAIISLSSILIGVLISINCLFQLVSLFILNNNLNLQRKISTVGILFYVILFSIGIAHFGNANPDSYSNIEVIHICFNMSLVIRNMSLLVKNWFARGVILCVPLVMIPFLFDIPCQSYLPLLILTFLNICLTVLLIYLDEQNMMISYDKEFKQRHQLQEWKNLIEKYIPHEIAIVRKVPKSELPSDHKKLNNKQRTYNNLQATLTNQPLMSSVDQLDQKEQKIGVTNISSPPSIMKQKQGSGTAANLYQNEHKVSLDMFQHNGMMYSSEQRNLTQSLFQDAHNDASIQNMKELERVFEESQQRIKMKQYESKPKAIHNNSNDFHSSEIYQNYLVMHKSSFNKNHNTKEENDLDEKVMQQLSQNSKHKQNQLTKRFTLEKYMVGEDDELQSQNFIQILNNQNNNNNNINNNNINNNINNNNINNKNPSSQNNGGQIESQNYNNTESNSVGRQNGNTSKTQNRNNNSQHSIHHSNSLGEYSQKCGLTQNQRQIISQNYNLSIRGNEGLNSHSQGKNLFLDPNLYSQTQSIQKIVQNLQMQKEINFQRPDQMSLENNDIETINNYKETIMNQAKQRQIQLEKKQKNQRHHSFNVFSNKYNQQMPNQQTKKMSFNSFAQLSQQGSISINIHSNQPNNSQHNIDSNNHSRTNSMNNDPIQYFINDAKNQIEMLQNHPNISPHNIFSEEVINSDININSTSHKTFVERLINHPFQSLQRNNNYETVKHSSLNKTINTIPLSCDNVQEQLRSDINQQNNQFCRQDTPLNKKQHCNKELTSSISSSIKQEQNNQYEYQDDNIIHNSSFQDQKISQIINTSLQQNIQNGKVKQDNGNENKNIDQIDIIENKQQSLIRQKSQTVYEKYSGTMSNPNIQENSVQKPILSSRMDNDRGGIASQKSQKQQAQSANKSIKKELNISLKLIKQYNGAQNQKKQTQISRKVVEEEELNHFKEAPYAITFPQINSRFAASFSSEEEEIRQRLKGILKDNVSIYERIQEYFQNNGINIHKNTSMQLGESNNELAQFNIDKMSSPIKNIKSQSKNRYQNSSPIKYHNEQKQRNQKEQLFEILGCFDSVSKKYYDIKIIPMQFEKNYSSLMIHFNDISDSVMNQRLQQAQKYKDLMLASISHDLRTPLNFIKLMTEKCSEEENLGVIKGILPMIKSNCEMLMSLINDILDHQQMQEGKFRLVPSNFSVNTLLEEIFQLFKIQSEEKNINIALKIDPNLSINSDKNRLKQIMINLMSNAIKYTQKGSIRISAHLVSDGNLLILSVKDSGCGIPQNLQDKLFQVYSTFDHAGGTNKHGVGLGLSLCRGLVSQLGPYHKIDLESKQGKGSKFSFKIWSNLEGQQNNQLKVSLNMDRILSESEDNSKIISIENYKEGNNDLDKIHEVQDDDQQSSKDSSFKMESSINNQAYFEEVPDYKNNLDMTPNSRVRCYTSFSSQKFQNKGQDILHVSSQFTPGSNCAGKSTFLKHHSPLSLQQQNDPLTENLREILSNFQRLLIVDDTVFNIIALKIWLKNFTIQIDTANDGREAYVKYQKNRYDLIIMDIQMPIMDGYQSTKLIRQYEQQNNLPRSVILIVSAFTSQGDVNKCINVGADDHISKPIERPIFCQVLKKLLQSNNAFQ